MADQVRARGVATRLLMTSAVLSVYACTGGEVEVVGTMTDPSEDQSTTDATGSGTSLGSTEVTSGQPGTTTEGSTTTDTASTAPETGSSVDPTPECGDGVVDPGEECDDGDNNADFGPCTTTCAVAFCGDGFVYNGSEHCDAGEQNGAPGSGCAEDCTIVGFCGDGVRDPLVEECDLGPENGGETCTETCALNGLLVFVSSSSFNGDLASHDPDGIDGIAGATAICQGLAEAAHLHDAASFEAWISADAQDAPAFRFPEAVKMGALPFLRPVDGAVVAMGWSQLTSGLLLNPINRTEFGDQLVGAKVWTNTAPDGTVSEPAASCDHWASASSQEYGRRGRADGVAGLWTQIDANKCYEEHHLYCVEMPALSE